MALNLIQENNGKMWWIPLYKTEMLSSKKE